MYIDSKILSKDSETLINSIISKYLAKIECNPYSQDLDCISNIYVISEVFDFLDDKDKWLDILACILRKLGSLYYERYRSLGSFNGVTAICHALSILTKKTNTFYAVKEQFDDVLLETAGQYIEYCISARSINVSHYDVISGLSGALNYLADLEKPTAKRVIGSIINYFALYAGEYELNGVLVPKWHIKPDQLNHYGKENFPEGNLDFGLAHGIAGPMMALSKTYQKIGDKRILEILKQLIELYVEYNYVEEGKIYWPAHLSLESYRKHNVPRNEVAIAPSWCYGNWSESLALKNAAESVGDEAVRKLAINNLEHCHFQRVKYFEPVICHGYGGNIIMSTKIFSNEINLTETINILTHNTLQFYDEQNTNLFSGLEDADSILTGCGGVVLALICALKGSSFLYDILMLNCGGDDAE